MGILITNLVLSSETGEIGYDGNHGSNAGTSDNGRGITNGTN